MSLPLTRRIARVALIVAAGAAPVIGAASSASAVELSPGNPLGGVSAVDAGSVAATADGTASQGSQLVGNTGGDAVKKAVPTAGKTVGRAGRTATPAAQKAAGETAATAGGVIGDTASGATGALGSASAGPKGGLPTGQLPVDALPLG
ncbi:ATP-binding protein [Streptomyces amakusaensis]|uniref:ATP-binding protein n=1 Tax=Streptomyces amakusaensis TaxID=67271 RepID=A0ABW0ADZ6_9ACTN